MANFEINIKLNIQIAIRGVCTDIEGKTVGNVNWRWQHSICIKGRGECPIVEKVVITLFRLAERED